MCLGLAGASSAAEKLPLLQVDPALLGIAPVKPAKPVASPSVAPAPAIQVQPAEPKSAAEVRPVTAPPVAKALPPAAAAAPIVAPVGTAAVPAVASRQEEATKSEPAAPAAVATETQPPQVAERPALPPLYTAHVAAGAIAPRATTPFSATDKASAPTHVTAAKIDGVNDVEMVAEGNAVLTRAGDTLAADRIVYRQIEDEVEATGNVRLSSPESLMTGPHLRMRMEESTGEFESPAYLLQRQPKKTAVDGLTPGATVGRDYVLGPGGKILVPPPRPPVTGSGTADRLEFRGEDQYHLENATYSTCAPGQRDWEVSVDELDLDYHREVGKGRNAKVSFKDVPIFYMPWMSFSLNNQKKSGFLPPTIGSTSKSGFEFTAPWLWNIAPNMDATITPRYMTRRGLQLNAEFRYLLNTPYNQATPMAAPDRGQVRVEYLPGDNLANRDRWGYSILHNQVLATGLTANLNLNGVSDPKYFSDLSTRIGQVSQGNLLRQGVLSYGGPWYGAALNVQSYQTLITEPGVTTPYRRMPQLTGYVNRYDLPFGSAFNLNAEYVSFDHPTQLLGKRTILYPQLSLPLATAAFWVTPKIGYHSTQYELSGQERTTVDATWKAVPATQSRGLPIASIDGGFVMERNLDWFGQSMLQTLEPRAYYLYVPKRDQKDIPIFDTGLAGFGYAQMFSENRYAGGDRIADANQLTLALTSRFIDPVSGAEYLRATLGQLYYFTTQNVTLPGETARTSRKTDILAALSGQVLPHTHADFGWQYNPRDRRTERLSVGGRYQPAYGKVFNAGYRYSRDLLDQIDVSAQWPVFGGWNAVGRYNYSLKESRVIETIAGFEYDAGCWAGRVVVQRLATIANQPTSALFFQLELKDFSRIGSNPLDLLRRSIPGYGVINQPTADPIFGAN
jgi:LPS-assembly protein